MTRSRPLANAGLLVASVLGTLLAGETTLRLAGYRYTPLELLPPERGADARRYHAQAFDPRVSGTEPVTLFDPVLLWRLNPRASFQIDEHGFRGPRVGLERDAGEVLLAALGDSNTLGPLHEADHWPGYLQQLAALDDSVPRIRVLNAGVYGYSSLQGLRRFRDVLAYRPAVAYWCFGANDAHPVQVSDAGWAGRAARLGLLSRSRLALFVAARLWRQPPVGASPLVPRVPVEDYRRNVGAFVAIARENGVRPVLLTRPHRGRSDDPGYWLTHVPLYNAATRDIARRLGVDLLDVSEAFRDAPEEFSDDSHLNRRGHQRLARLLARQLRVLGVRASERLYASQLDLGATPDHRPELASGWWHREPWQRRPAGRWTAAEAVVMLERRGHERHLALDLTFAHPGGRTCGRVEACGREVHRFCHRNGRHAPVVDIAQVPGSTVAVRLVTDNPFVPGSGAPGPPDSRELGMFVHGIALRDTAVPTHIDLAEAEDGRPELAGGWWSKEVWPDGRAGRWTRDEARLLLARVPGARSLVFDVSAENTRPPTQAHIQIAGEAVGRFEVPNGRHPVVVRLPEAAFETLEIVIRVDNPFEPREAAASGEDPRRLGLFVHSVRPSVVL